MIPLLLLQIVLVDAADSPAARSLKALWPDLKVVDAPVEGKLVIGLKGDLAAYRKLSGTVVVDLAVLGPVEEVRIENPNRLPIDPYDIKTIEELGRAWEKEPGGERTRALRDGLIAEVGEPIPRMRVLKEDPALRGFPVGSLVPWCADKKGVYVQRTSAAEGALAVSEQNGKAVILRQGSLYAMDLGLEEFRLRWDGRGALHKWVPVSNLAGRGVLAGRYWTSKPTYQEFLKELRAFAERHPEWAPSVIGRRGDDEILAFTMGDASKELHVFVGMFHAMDEWAPALGALSLMELLSRERPSRPVKVIPIVKPSLYDGQGRDEIHVQKDRIHSLVQLHQGGDVLVPACGTSMALGKRAAERARDTFTGRHAMWPSGLSKVEPMHPTWAAYWWQDRKTSVYGLYPHDAVFSAKALWFVEQDFLFLMPERFTQSNAHHWHHRMLFEHSSVATLLLSDQTANWGWALVTTEPADGDRDPAWKP